MRALVCRVGSLALCALLVALVHAQDAFPDTPQNHWAYEALAEAKKDGLLVGYPDGLYRGARPASRYELAVAFHEAYVNLHNRLDALDAIATTRPTEPQNLDNLHEQLDALRAELAQMKGWGDEIANLKRASDTFEIELEQLGVDVEAMKHDLGTLSDRVGALEKKKPPVDIHGEADFWAGTGDSRGDYYGLDKDGRLVGIGSITPGLLNPPVAAPAGLGRDMITVHEAAFTLSGTNEKGPQWDGTFVLSDAFGNPKLGTVAFGNQSDVFNPSYSPNVTVPFIGADSLNGYFTGYEDAYFQTLEARFGGPRANVEVGRLGYSIGPYMMQRIDNSSYFHNERWDNGQYYFDGAILGFDFGPAKLNVFGGRNSGVTTVGGVELNPMRTGPWQGFIGLAPTLENPVPPSIGTRLTIDRSLGAKAELNAGKVAQVDLAYLLLESDAESAIQIGQNVDRLSVYGADANMRVGPLSLQGGVHKSDLTEGGTAVDANTNQNGAWNFRVGTDQRHFNLFGEYRQVEANYLAPGDWGRLGVLRNPSNIKGVRVGGALNLGPRVTISAHGEFDSGLSNSYSPTTFLGTQTGINSYNVRLEFKLRRNLSLFGEYEDTRFEDLASTPSYVGAGTPDYRWRTVGLGYGINPNARFDIQYELSDIDNDYQVSNGNSFHGGFLTTQFTIRF